ncbi:MAG: pyridoxal phosphate-dependent aminotransferase [Oceanospirillaceae bacterium]|nr:pyridoxal phosphate-dependent aminotransferase [Oceanospirillaceae bacterium]
MKNMNILENISARSKMMDASKIREIAELGMLKNDVLALWFGEGAWPTNPLIVEAAVASIESGNHKYQPNNGAMNLRHEICRYSNDLFDCELTPERITVSSSGMQGLKLTAELLITPGDKVITIEPGWPSTSGAFKLAGANIKTIALTPKNGTWNIDIDQLVAMLTPEVKAVIINSPNNPTGWTMTAEDQQVILDHCRKHSIWIVADDVYARIYRHGKTAPSFLSIADPDDLLISVNSFSKSWSMTGWRLGWIVAPALLEAKFAQLTEFNMSCTAGFIQEAGLAALKYGEDEVTTLLNRIEAGYKFSATQLSSFERVEFIQPDGAFYCFFRVVGLTDSLAVAKDILHETGVGLAPGIAFGATGESYLRLCYAQPLDLLEKAFERLTPFLNRKN